MPHLSPREFTNQSIIFFVTQVVAGRRPLLTRPESRDSLVRAWQKAEGWEVGRYILMPDHLHFFCAPKQIPAPSFSRWQAYWRWEVSRHWPWPGERPVWQKDFFDRQLRCGESYWAKWCYLRENAVCAGLAATADDWEWQGELNPLLWHEPV